MNTLATLIGYGVLLAVAACAAVALFVLAVRHCPIRFDWIRGSPSHLATPYGKLPIRVIVGISGRTRTKWFLGFMVVGEPERSEAV